MPEPASAILRRLHARADEEACERIDDALPALADLVKETEALGCHECGRSRIVAGKPCEAPLCRSLATLRERLGARP